MIIKSFEFNEILFIWGFKFITVRPPGYFIRLMIFCSFYFVFNKTILHIKNGPFDAVNIISNFFLFDLQPYSKDKSSLLFKISIVFD